MIDSEKAIHFFFQQKFDAFKKKYIKYRILNQVPEADGAFGKKPENSNYCSYTVSEINFFHK